MLRLGDDAGAAGYSLVTLETVDSTNRLALDLAEQVGANKTWVLSETQRAGRGRHGREWASPPGNLYSSLLLVSPCPPEDAPKLGFVAGVAIHETIQSFSPTGAVRLKWPNDLLVGSDKLAGILLEGRFIAGNKHAVAIGIGTNIKRAPNLVVARATALTALDVTTDRREVFRRLSNRMTHWLSVFARGAGFAAVRDAWSAAAIPLGTPISVKLTNAEKAGRFNGIDDRGRLLLETSQGVIHIDAGDVFLTGGPNG